MPANTNIFARLSTDATLGPLVTNGDSPETFKIYPMFMPQGVSYPALRYQNISSEPQNTFNGESDQQNDRVQIDIYSDSYDETQTVADAVVAAMAGTGNSFKALRLSRIDLQYDTDVGIYQTSIDFSVWYI